MAASKVAIETAEHQAVAQPAPVAIEDLQKQFAGLQAEAHDLVEGIEGSEKEAIELERQADARRQTAEMFGHRGDPSRRDAELRKVPALVQEAERVQGRVGAYERNLVQLQEHAEQLREISHQLLLKAESDLRAAKVRRNLAAGLFANVTIGDLRRAEALLGKWKASLPGYEKPAVIQQAAAPESANAKLPNCPRCHANHDVSKVGENNYSCHRAHHGRLVFDGEGHILRQARATASIGNERVVSAGVERVA